MDGLAEEGPGDGPVARLASRLDDDETLVEAALAGFRSLLDRDDLPDLVQIAKLHESRRLSYFALPFLAGMAEEEREAGDPLDRLGEKGRRRALGYYLVSRLPSKRYSPEKGPVLQEDTRPPWYLRALDSLSQGCSRCAGRGAQRAGPHKGAAGSAPLRHGPRSGIRARDSARREADVLCLPYAMQWAAVRVLAPSPLGRDGNQWHVGRRAAGPRASTTQA